MVTRQLTAAPRGDLVAPLATAYTTGATLLLAVAAICATSPTARWLAHSALSLALHVHLRPAPAPTIHTASGLLIDNLRATGWPLLACALNAQNHPGVRRVVHAAAVASLAINLLPVGAALGVYRSRLTPYLPHLPLELYAITTGPTTWLLYARGQIDRRQLVLIAISILVALTGATILETWAVPHR